MERRQESVAHFKRSSSRRLISRRGPTLAAGLVLTFAGVGTAFIGLRAITDEHSEPGSLIGSEFENDHGHLMVIDPLLDNPEIPIRSEATLGDDNIIGWAKAGDFFVQARAHYGVTYPGEWGLGQKLGPDGKLYGEWFKLQGIEVYNRNGDETSKKVVNNVFVAGNFVREATDQEKHQFYSSRE